jgi:hypothetical protein
MEMFIIVGVALLLPILLFPTKKQVKRCLIIAIIYGVSFSIWSEYRAMTCQGGDHCIGFGLASVFFKGITISFLIAGILKLLWLRSKEKKLNKVSNR